MARLHRRPPWNDETSVYVGRDEEWDRLCDDLEKRWKLKITNSAAEPQLVPALDGSCNSTDCTNPPTVSIGALRLCNACVESAAHTIRRASTAIGHPRSRRSTPDPLDRFSPAPTFFSAARSRRANGLFSSSCSCSHLPAMERDHVRVRIEYAVDDGGQRPQGSALLSLVVEPIVGAFDPRNRCPSNLSAISVRTSASGMRERAVRLRS